MDTASSTGEGQLLFWPLEPVPPPLRARYLAAVAHEWDPVEARANWYYFRTYIVWLRQEIRLWYDEHGIRYAKHDCLTAIAWHVGSELLNRGITGRLLDFNEHKQRFYLAAGLLELCKLLCRDVEQERKYSHLLLAS